MNLFIMNILLLLVSVLTFLETVHLLPIQQEDGFGENFGLNLAKRPFYPYREIFSPFGFIENPREVNQGQRKKAVDSTFIRFGRSSSPENRNARDLQAISASSNLPKPGEFELFDNAGDSDSFKVSAQRLLLNHNGCKVANSRELMKALLYDPNCIRAFQKVKKENVNDTFIRFGKREAPPEMESQNAER